MFAGELIGNKNCEIAEVALPPMAKKVVIRGRQQGKLLPDGRVNPHYSVKSPAVAFNRATGEAVMFFQGKEPGFRTAEDDSLRSRTRRNAVYAATSSDGWESMSYFDSTARATTELSEAAPVITSADTTGFYAKNGHIDPRLCPFTPPSGDPQYFISVSAFNGELFELSRRQAGSDLRIPVDGGRLELFTTSDLNDPESFQSLGLIGPEEYFRNVLVHPVPVLKDEVPHLMIIGRKMPGIQAYYVPLDDFDRLGSDEAFRKEFWKEQLHPDNVRKNTILDPIFPWEGKDDPHNPLGQIAGGAPPIEVSYYDACQGKEVKNWLLFYNAVPMFNEGMRGKGRVVGAALLDYDDPQKVVARSPRPIITPTTDEEFSGDVSNVTFATGAYVDNTRNINVFCSAADSDIIMVQTPMEQFMKYMTQYDQYGQRK